MSENSKPVIIDCDLGVDDAMKVKVDELVELWMDELEAMGPLYQKRLIFLKSEDQIDRLFI